MQTLLGVSLCLFGRARLDLEQKYNASSFKFRTLDLVYVLFEEVLLMCEKKKETAPHAYAALCSRSRVIVIPRSILEQVKID